MTIIKLPSYAVNNQAKQKILHIKKMREELVNQCIDEAIFISKAKAKKDQRFAIRTLNYFKLFAFGTEIVYEDFSRQSALTFLKSNKAPEDLKWKHKFAMNHQKDLEKKCETLSKLNASGEITLTIEEWNEIS